MLIQHSRICVGESASNRSLTMTCGKVIKLALEAKGPDNMDSVHIKAHKTRKEKASLSEQQMVWSQMNDEADAAAVRAAKTWALPSSLHDEVAAAKKLAIEVHWMMITIITARSLTRKELGYSAMEAQAERLREQAKAWMDDEWFPNPDKEDEEDPWAGFGFDDEGVEDTKEKGAARLTPNRGLKRMVDDEVKSSQVLLASTAAEQLAKTRREDVFPCYAWHDDTDQKEMFFEPQIPQKLTIDLWMYPQSLFPSLVWYWQQVHFAKEGTSTLEDTTWAEIAVDFQHATHEDLDRQDAEDATLERRARFFAAATMQMAKICKTNILGKAFRRQHNDKSNSLQPPATWMVSSGRDAKENHLPLSPADLGDTVPHSSRSRGYGGCQAMQLHEDKAKDGKCRRPHMER